MSDAGLAQSFLAAAAELGMCSAAWLFVHELAAHGGEAQVAQTRDRLGRTFPVFDAVCGLYLDGQRSARVDASAVVAACDGARRVLVVGVETEFLDVLVPRVDAELGLLTFGELDTDWARVISNYGGRVVPCELPSFQRMAGSRSVLLTFLYGKGGTMAHVGPAWLRVIAGDVRTQFRTVIGWDVLGSEMFVYPRWLVQSPLSDFSVVAG